MNNGTDGTQSHSDRNVNLDRDRLTMAEAARVKGVSYHTVSRAVRKGRLPVERLGRMALISARDLHAWRPMKDRAPRKYRCEQAEGNELGSEVGLLTPDHVTLARRLAALYEGIHSVASDGTIEEVAQIATEQVAEALYLDRMSLWLVDADANQGTRLAVVREPLSNLLDTVALDAFPIFSALMEEPSARITADPLQDVPLGAGYTFPPGPLLIVPLLRKNRIVGVMFGDRYGNDIDFTQEQLGLADGVASQVAIALDNTRLRQNERRRRLQMEAILDELVNAVSAFDEQGFLTLSNSSERALFDLNEQESRLGQHASEYLQTKFRHGLEATGTDIDDSPVMRVLHGERSQSQDQVITRNNGETLLLRTSTRPIIVHDKIVGAISVSRDVTPEHRAEIRDRQQLQQLERAAHRSQAIADLVVQINTGRDRQTVVDTALRRLVQELDADCGAIMLHGEDDHFYLSASRGIRPELFPSGPMDILASPVVAGAFKRYRPLVVPLNELRVPEPMASELGDEAVAMIIPMQMHGQRIGVAFVGFTQQPTLDDSDLAFGAIWGRQCAQAIDKVMLVGQLEYAHGRLMAIIDQLPQAVLILDEPTRVVIVANQAADRLWGRSLEDGHIHPESLPVVDADGVPLVGEDHPLLRPLQTHKEVIGQPIRVVQDDGTQVEVVANHAPIFDGRGAIIGSVGLLQDRSDFKPLDRAKDEFISVVAHELRNPLTSLRGNLQLMQRRIRKRADEHSDDELERLDSVITQVDRIADLVSRMLDVSRVDLGSLDIAVAETDASMLARLAVTEAKGLNPDRPFVLEGPETLPVVWDAARVQQVLGNLMQNAARYAPEGPVEVNLCETGTDRVKITVRDHGPGVPAKIQKRLFKQYYRFDDGQDDGEAATNGSHGLGIGLYISARLAKAHGGSLSVDDADGGGAIFTLELPKDASCHDTAEE
jgi:excisionase family DNA binding protein